MYETFDEFYSKLSSIRNNTINLGKKMSGTKMIKKILRSLPTRFLPSNCCHKPEKRLRYNESRGTCRVNLDF
jgi:hypothetical protein